MLNDQNGSGLQVQQPLAKARPKMMIEIAVAGIKGTQIYPVDVARQLYYELGLSLASIDATEDPALAEADAETDPESQSPTPDDQDPETLDEPDSVEGEATPQDA